MREKLHFGILETWFVPMLFQNDSCASVKNKAIDLITDRI